MYRPQTGFRRTLLALHILLIPTLLAAQHDTETKLEMATQATAESPERVAEIEVGAYVLHLRDVSPKDGHFEVDTWLWFRWDADDIRPDLSFEFANGMIHSRSEYEVERDLDKYSATFRVQATIFHEFDVRRYPMDNHVLELQIEDQFYEDSYRVYVADQEGTSLDPGVAVAGWATALLTPKVLAHTYPTSYGLRYREGEHSTYSRLVIPISLKRASYSGLFKSLWISVLAVILSLLALLVRADDLDARFGMGVGSIFAASANGIVLTEALPLTHFVTLVEQLNLIAVGVIFSTVFISIWSLRLSEAGREETSARLDRWALYIFTATFVLAVLIVLNFDLAES